VVSHVVLQGQRRSGPKFITIERGDIIDILTALHGEREIHPEGATSIDLFHGIRLVGSILIVLVSFRCLLTSII